MASNDLKGIPVAPLTGVMDARSSPDAMPAQSLRLRQNYQTTAQGKLRRGTGWQKLLSRDPYNNQDFHDQLLVFGGGIRQPVTLEFEAESTRGVRSLFVATQSRIGKLNEYGGNYRILGSGFGGTQTTSAAASRFHAAQVGDFLAFTNDFEPPMYHQLEQNGVDTVEPLIEFSDFDLIGLTRARVVFSWNNVLFFADVEMDGERFSYRLLWSDYNNPTSFDPAVTSSITGSKDLFTHEKILGGLSLGKSFLIYTNQGIWEMVIAGGDQTFAFRRVYDGEKNQGVGVLKYPNTLVNVGDSHAYGGEDGLYTFNQYAGKPERVEWLHRASSIIYDELDPALCDVHVANFSRNELMVSVARRGAAFDCPDITLRANMSYQVADIVDHGFTAFCNYRSYRVPTIRDFIIQNSICTIEALETAGYGWVDEGLPVPAPEPTAPFVPTHFVTGTTQIIDGVTVEDWNVADPDADSLCALLGDLRLDDLCRGCSGTALLVGASSVDWCLKQLGDIFYRELCNNPTGVGAGGGIS